MDQSSDDWNNSRHTVENLRKQRGRDGQQSELQKKRRKLLESVNSWVPPKCCRKYCVTTIGTETCRKLRVTFLNAPRDARKAMLRDFASERDQSDGFSFVVNGSLVCWNLLISTLNVSRSMISNVLQLPSANASQLPGRIRGTDGSFTLKSGVFAFLRILADEVADELPNCNQRHLPHGNKRIVFLLYEENERRYARLPCRSSHFYNIWKQFLPHIKCRRNHGFTVCDTCTHFKERLEQTARLPGYDRERGMLSKGFRQHLNHVHAERAEYRIAQLKAIEKPKEFLSVIIDGADQAKFALPRFPTNTKRESGNAMKQKVTGVLFHGGVNRTELLSFFTSADNLPAGANQTIDAFCRALFVLNEKRQALGMSFLPQEVYIQLDNTTKDNKNRFFMAFCDYVIHIGLFSRVTVNFLPVGHTHEDIDRKFSRVSVHLKQRSTVTVEDLHTALRNSQIGRNESFVARVDGMNNFSGAIVNQKLIVQQVEGLLSYRKFVFERDLSKAGEEEHYHVDCLVGHSMSEKRTEWLKLNRKEGYIGTFLKETPNMSRAPLVQTKSISQRDMDDFRKRLRLTEGRITDVGRTESLRRELERMGNQQVASPDWSFCRLRTLAIENIRRRLEEYIADKDDDEVEDEVIVRDGSTYEVGEMVAVNCGAESTSATPFWLGRIDEVSTSVNGAVKLSIWWYEIYGRKNREDLCYTATYRPMKLSPDCRSVIPKEAVLVYFHALNNGNTIPDYVQRLTREALDPFQEESNSAEVVLLPEGYSM